MRILGATEYLDFMARAGLFSASAAVPEHNTAVWRAYRRLVAEWTPAAAREPTIHLLCDRFGLFLDPADDGREGLNWALVTPIVDPCLPLRRDEFERALPGLIEAIGAAGLTVLTDTFCLVDGYPERPARPLIGLHSPIAALADDFAAYGQSLTGHRRRKYQRLARAFGDPRFRVELSPRPLSERELGFAADNLRRRWGADDYAYAMIQTLWTEAVAAVMPAQALYTRLYERDRLIFVQTMVIRLGGLYAQSIFKSEDEFHDGVAAWIDFATIRSLCGGPHRFLDPSCRATFSDPPSIGVAKRATVNTDVVKPLLAVGVGLPAAVKEALADGRILGDPARS